jgi:hypothetical protein
MGVGVVTHSSLPSNPFLADRNELTRPLHAKSKGWRVVIK